MDGISVNSKGLSVLFSRVRLFATPWTVACQASLSITTSQSLLKLHRVGDAMDNNISLSRWLNRKMLGGGGGGVGGVPSKVFSDEISQSIIYFRYFSRNV